MDDKNLIIIKRILEEIILITNEANKISPSFQDQRRLHRAFQD